MKFSAKRFRVYALAILVLGLHTACDQSTETDDDIPNTGGTLADFQSVGYGGLATLSDGIEVSLAYEYPANCAYCNNNGGFPLGCIAFDKAFGATGNPLTTLYTASIRRGLLLYDYNEVLSKMCRNAFSYTRDLNYDSGDYTHIFFGGLPSLVANLGEYKGSGGVYETGMLGTTTITGLRLVRGNDDDAPETIVKDGITWRWCPGQSGHHDDMNNNHGGDYLFVYYTTDYTGRKLMLTFPGADETYSKYSDFKSTTYVKIAFSSPCHWLFYKNDDPVKESIYDIKSKMYKDLYSAFSSDMEKFGDYQQMIWMVRDNLDFVRLYDLKMNEINPGYPADFNSGTGDRSLYVSYTSITPADLEWWNKF